MERGDTNFLRTEDIDDNIVISFAGGRHRLSDELDEKGHPFVLAPNGSPIFGEIGEETGLTPAPIKLSEGEITNPVTNAGYGYIHIDARHGEEIRSAGFESIEAFACYVIANYDRILEGKEGSAGGEESFLMQVLRRHNDTIYIELSNDGSYWEINSGGTFKRTYGNNRKVVYNRHTTAKQSAEIAEVSQNAEQCGTQANSRMNTSTPLSDDKGSEISETSKGKGDFVEAGRTVPLRLYHQRGIVPPDISGKLNTGVDWPLNLRNQCLEGGGWRN